VCSTCSGGRRDEVIVRTERPHCALLPFTYADGLRLTAFVTNTAAACCPTWSCSRGRRQAKDRIRTAKDTGPGNLPCMSSTRTPSVCHCATGLRTDHLRSAFAMRRRVWPILSLPVLDARASVPVVSM